ALVRAFCIFVAGQEFSFCFQAEDGIRDFHMTGVQTCALPISYPRCIVPIVRGPCAMSDRLGLWIRHVRSLRKHYEELRTGKSIRSEERRVGKGCSSRGRRNPSEKRDSAT